MNRFDDAHADMLGDLLHTRTLGPCLPRPLVAEPERGQYMEFSRLRSAVVNADLDEDVFGRLLGIFDEDVKVAILIENTAVEQFVFEFVASPPAAGVNQVGIREGRLRILVEVLHVRVGRGTVEVEVVFLDVLAVIALAVGQAK